MKFPADPVDLNTDKTISAVSAWRAAGEGKERDPGNEIEALCKKYNTFHEKFSCSLSSKAIFKMAEINLVLQTYLDIRSTDSTASLSNCCR